MGWRGTLRSINAAVKEAERAEKRKQRELDKRRNEVAKMQAIEQAAYQVEDFENKLEILQSLHKEHYPVIDWQLINEMPAPEKPEDIHLHEERARYKRDNFRPSFFCKILGCTEKKLATLESEINIATQEDSKETEAAILEWSESIDDWKHQHELSVRVLAGESQAKIDVIEDVDPFSELSLIGADFHFSATDKSPLEVILRIHSDSIIPKEQKSLLKSGKISVKKMPIGRFNELYQDYVCSSILRIANDVFSILPEQSVIIHAQDDLLNSATGYLELQTILSVFIPRKTLENMNLDNIDPSDSMSNFLYHMSFKKTKGFDAVEKIDMDELTNM